MRLNFSGRAEGRMDGDCKWCMSGGPSTTNSRRNQFEILQHTDPLWNRHVFKCGVKFSEWNKLSKTIRQKNSCKTKQRNKMRLIKRLIKTLIKMCLS